MSNDNLADKNYEELLELRHDELDKIDAAIAEKLRDRILELVKQNVWNVDKYKPRMLRLCKTTEEKSIELQRLLSPDSPAAAGKMYNFDGIMVYSKNGETYLENTGQFDLLTKFIIDNSIIVSFASLSREASFAKQALENARTIWDNSITIVEEKKLSSKANLTTRDNEYLKYLRAKIEQTKPTSDVMTKAKEWEPIVIEPMLNKFIGE